MTANRWAEVERLYHEALARAPEARGAFLREACAGDRALGDAVEALLAQPTSGALLDGAAVTRAAGLMGPPEASVLTGRKLGVYQVHERLGVGGMGEVYRARDTRLGRDVAIKILPRDVRDDPDRLARFEREAQALAALNHPHIGAIYGVEDTDGIPALVLELVEGPTLADRIARGRRGGLPVAEVLGIARQIADALDAAHEKGIVHRDLKPANVKVRPDGTVKVLDFGLAKLQPGGGVEASEALTVDQTQAGLIVGTVAYMSPEQARGQAVDKRTDIWAFGCVLYEMLTGRPAFAAQTMSDTLAAILEREPSWPALPPSTPREVVTLIRRCLDKDRKTRLRDIGDARVHLDRESPEAPPPPSRIVWRALAPWAISAVLAIALVALRGSEGADREADLPEYARATRLTTGAAVEMGPVISPDGQWVAFFSNAGGTTDLMVRYLAGGETVRLTGASGLQLPTRIDIGGPAISPDGSLIAFDAGATPGTPSNLFDAWVIPAPLGGIPRKLVERGRGLRWSPDGARIAYIRAGAAAGDSIYVANADGSDERLVLPTHGGMHAHWIQWAHDGSAIYFTYSPSTANSEPAQIFKVAVEGGDLVPVIQTARRAAFPALLSDGGGLVYAANPETSESGLWWRSLDGALTRRLTVGLGEYTEPSISRDGRRLVASSVQWDYSLVTLNTEGSTLLELLDASGGDLDPTVSPDGSRVVFSSARAGSRTLWNATLADKQIRPLTSGDVFDERPSFSPDGARIAFVSDRGGRRGIWVMNSDGGAARHVTDADVIDAVTWSPDGSVLVFSASAGATPGLFVVNVGDGSTRRLETPGPATSPAWCAKRDVIVYVEARAGAPDQPNSSRVAAITSAGAPVDLGFATSPNVLNGFVSCSWDGSRVLAVVDPGAAPAAIWLGDVARNGPFRRIYQAPPHARFRGVAWLPESSSVIVGRSIRSADVVLFERVE